jgi:hypothetical protein
MRCFSVILFLNCFIFSFSQSDLFSIRFGSDGPDNSSCMDDQGDIMFSQDGGYIFTGTWGGNITDRDIMLVKFTSSGDTVWTRIFNEPNEYQIGRALTPFGENDFVLLTENGGSDCGIGSYIIRMNNSGNIIWSKSIWTQGVDVLQTKDGNILAMYPYVSPTMLPSFERGVLIIKFDPDGNIIWDKGFVFAGKNLLPYGNLLENDDGSILISGQMGYTANMFLMKIDSLGNFLWSNTLNIASPNTGEEGFNIYTYPDGNSIGIGLYSDTDYTYKTLLYKVNSSGQFLWCKKIKLLTNTMPSALCGDGFRAFIGGSTGDAINGLATLMEIDSSGNVIWVNYYPSVFGGLNECICNDTEIVSSGYYYHPSNNYKDGLIIKSSVDGNSCDQIHLTDISVDIPFIAQSHTPIIESSFSVTSDCPVNMISGMNYNIICKTASVHEIDNNELKIYPNPVTDHLKIDLPKKAQNNNLFISLFDNQGMLIFKVSQIATANTIVIPLENIANGFYTLNIQAEDFFYQKKVVVHN